MPSAAGLAAGHPAPSRAPWWMFALAAAFAGYFGLLLYSDFTRPEPTGFIPRIRDSTMTLNAVLPGSPAGRAGLLPGDRVLAANGIPIRNRLDWLSTETNLQIGGPLTLSVARDGAPRSATLVLSRTPARFWLSTAGTTLLLARAVQLVTLVFACVVAFKRPGDLTARLGGWLLATIAVYSIVLPYGIASTWRALPRLAGLALWLPLASSLAVAAVFFTFFAMFPRPLVPSRVAWAALWTPMALAVWPQLRFAARMVYGPGGGDGSPDWTAISISATSLYTVGALGVLLAGYRRLTDVTERRRVRVLVFGSVIGFAGLLPVISAYWTRPDAATDYSAFASPVAALGTIAGLALPTSFAYAILRHRLFGVGHIIRRGLQYALARRVLVSAVPALAALFLADLWFHRQAPMADVLRARGWVYAGLATMAVVARTQRDTWLDALDRRFFRERYGAERLLRAVTEQIRHAASVALTAPRVMDEIEDALHPEFAALLLRSAVRDSYDVIAVIPPHADPGPLASTHKVVGLLEWLQKPLQVPAADRAGLLRQLPGGEMDWLRRSAAEMVVPLGSIHKGSVDGLIVLGAKRSEEPYSVQDEDLLMAIGDSLGLLVAREAPASQTSDLLEVCPECGTCYDFGTTRCPRDGAALAVLSLPRLLGGRYRLERRVGRGGMGTVYAAHDAALSRLVAAKVLRDDLVGGAQAAERFQAEARLAAALAHPNVVTVHDIGVTASGRGFFIMELLEGKTLRQELQHEGRLAPSRVLHIMRGVSAAVDAAHGRNLIHRDLKPENIFLCQSNDLPKVMDFGLAKALEASATTVLTEPGFVAGTPPYMAPEHIRGGEPSADWDLWALAVTAFEMIAGDIPFAGAPGTNLRLDYLPAALRPVFSRALAADPLDRPTSAAEFLNELDRAFAVSHA
jgi:tRNA A-37 threonylcarbamoyl transferase component Bud32